MQTLGETHTHNRMLILESRPRVSRAHHTTPSTARRDILPNIKHQGKGLNHIHPDEPRVNMEIRVTTFTVCLPSTRRPKDEPYRYLFACRHNPIPLFVLLSQSKARCPAHGGGSLVIPTARSRHTELGDAQTWRGRQRVTSSEMEQGHGP